MQDTIGRFRTDMEAELLQLRRELLTQTYTPGSYRETIITRPKRRMISATPFRDRVVHHALCNVVMPLFERKMIFDLYSNRAGKGTHAAIRRAQQFCGRFDFVLKCDVRKFFPSMDHAVLKATIRQTIACRDTLWLLEKIVDGSNRQEPVCQVFPGDDLAEAAARRVGLPIGNLTSQWFGGVYMTAFDHWVKETLRCPGYVRYVDDFLLFADDKAQLTEWRAAIVGRLHHIHHLAHLVVEGPSENEDGRDEQPDKHSARAAKQFGALLGFNFVFPLGFRLRHNLAHGAVKG
jgi:hypothetical protein